MIYLLGQIVESKGGPGGGGFAEAGHEGLAAVMASPNGYAVSIKESCYVVRVNPINGE